MKRDMAMDWCVKADHGAAEDKEAALHQCWDEQMGNHTTPAWWWPSDELLLRPLVRVAAPELLRPWFNASLAIPFSSHAESNFRAYLDLAVLSNVDTRACDPILQGRTPLGRRKPPNTRSSDKPRGKEVLFK